MAGAVASELTIPSTIGILTTANAGRSPFHAGSPRSGGRLGQQAQQVGSIPANGDIIVTQKVLAREMIFKELNKTGEYFANNKSLVNQQAAEVAE